MASSSIGAMFSLDMMAPCPGTISSVCLSLWVILNAVRTDRVPRSWWVAQVCWQECSSRPELLPQRKWHRDEWSGRRDGVWVCLCLCVCACVQLVASLLTSLWSSTTLSNVSMVLRMPIAVTALSSPPSSSGPVWITWLNVIACQREREQLVSSKCSVLRENLYNVSSL